MKKIINFLKRRNAFGSYYIDFDGLRFYGYKDSIWQDIQKRYVKPVTENYIDVAKYYDVKGKVVLEVGAYLGYYCMQLDAKKIYAIEAIPKNFWILSHNIMFNRLRHIEPFCFAAWDKEEKIKIYTEGKQKAGAHWKGKEIIVQARPLDDLNIEPDFVRIQVNGSELKVLKGLTKTIKKHKPEIMVSAIYGNADKVKKYLEKLGYRCEINQGTVFT